MVLESFGAIAAIVARFFFFDLFLESGFLLLVWRGVRGVLSRFRGGYPSPGIRGRTIGWFARHSPLSRQCLGNYKVWGLSPGDF